jgi:site-specific DNA-adenine methylase
MRPFFGFYGGKWRDALRNYPQPEFSTIVEPFAGSAGYSVRYAHHKVHLYELDPILVAVWKYLIGVKPSEILGICDVPPQGTVDDLKVSQEARWLVGLWLNRAANGPRRAPSKWMRDGIRPGSFWGKRVRETIAKQVDLIRHWKVHNCSYEDCPLTQPSTWFIDPPYQLAGRHYRYGSDRIKYKELALWCRSRSGQVIVCENAGANWLPFKRLADVKTTRTGQRSKEVYWVRAGSTNEVAGAKPSA